MKCNVTAASWFAIFVLLFGVGETPNLVDLDAAAPEMTKSLILIGRTSLTSIDQQFGDVCLLQPFIRSMARMELPSHSMCKIWVRLSGGSLFMRELWIDIRNMRDNNSHIANLY